jgi:long-chain-alcohol oxidase
MVTRCIREAVVLAWVVLWVLSTRVGTLLLCGRLCVAGGFPYVRKFADMTPERREAALQRWNRVRWLFPLRIAFAIVKILCHYVFYAMVRPPLVAGTVAPPLASFSAVPSGHPVQALFGSLIKQMIEPEGD